jgi:hypothetical protein
MPGQDLNLGGGVDNVAAAGGQTSMPAGDLSSQAMPTDQAVSGMNGVPGHHHPMSLAQAASHQAVNTAPASSMPVQTSTYPMSPVPQGQLPAQAPLQAPGHSNMGGALTPITDNTAVNSTSVPATETDTPISGYGDAGVGNLRRQP